MEQSKIDRKTGTIKSIIVTSLLFLLITGSELLAWQDSASKYIYGSRKDNQFSLALGFSSYDWKLHSSDYFTTPSISLKFLYRFQLQLFGKIGYFLGTSFGFNYFFPAEQRNFYSLSLPGAAAGLTWFINEKWLVLLAAEIFLERVPKLPVGNSTVSGISLESFGGGVIVEHYLALDYAVSVGIGLGGIVHETSRKSSGSAGQLERNSLACHIGINYHLL